MNACVHFECSGELAARLSSSSLQRRGFQVIQSFGLSGADSDACGCPHHGTPACTCQYSVLLIYPASGPPAVLTVHGREGRSRVEIALDANSPTDPKLAEMILSALAEACVEPGVARLSRSEPAASAI